jgi:hypothetical protein
MSQGINPADYVWVVTETVGQNEGLYALEDEAGKKYIPVFQSQDDGLAVKARLEKKPEGQYQIEAMHLGQVSEAARTNGADIFVLDAEGRIVDRLTAAPNA